MGRLCTLDEPVSLATMIERIKRHLKLSHIRLALGVGRTLGKFLFYLSSIHTINVGQKLGLLTINVSERKPASSHEIDRLVCYQSG